jgi:hypothetical protein
VAEQKPQHPQSLAERLEQRLDEIVVSMDALLDASTIDFVRERAVKAMQRMPGVITMIADGQWGELDDVQRRAQRRLLELWEPWVEQVRLLFASDTKDAQRTVEEAIKAISEWIHRTNHHDWSLPPTITEAKSVFRKKAAPLHDALRALGNSSGSVVAIPDTNVLIRTPDVTSYGSVLGTSEYVVLFVPGVLGELDEHKVNHRNPDVRAKAQSMSGRIKGWRNQGDLAKGVRVQGNVWARVEGKEPDFSKTLSWLQPDVIDDRIIATMLEVQRRRPGDRIVLLTGDTLMLAKADAASIPTADTPDPDP